MSNTPASIAEQTAFQSQTAAAAKLEKENSQARAARDTSNYKSLEYTTIPILPETMAYGSYSNVPFEPTLNEINAISENYKSNPVQTDIDIKWYRENPNSPLANLKTKLSLLISEQIETINSNSEAHHVNEGYIATVIKFSDLDLQITLKGQYGSSNVSGFIEHGDDVDPTFLDILTFLVQGSHGGYGVNLQM